MLKADQLGRLLCDISTIDAKASVLFQIPDKNFQKNDKLGIQTIKLNLADHSVVLGWDAPITHFEEYLE